MSSEIDLNFVKVPADASAKMSDELMDKLEPFPYDQLKEFKTPYLAGFIAEKYNYDDKELLPRVKEKVQSFVDSYIQSTVSQYHTIQFKNKDVRSEMKRSYYVLLPVWMLHYDYNHKEYIFAMNGQTGKVVGKPPLSKGKMAAWFGGVAGITFFGLKIVAFLLGGGFW